MAVGCAVETPGRSAFVLVCVGLLIRLIEMERPTYDERHFLGWDNELNVKDSKRVKVS